MENSGEGGIYYAGFARYNRRYTAQLYHSDVNNNTFFNVTILKLVVIFSN